MSQTPRVLSVQSHVVHGYVGNKSATFPLQLLGFEVDAINSVQFSNHTGYKLFKGQVLTDKDLGDLVDTLSANEIDTYTHLLTGYIGNPTFLERVAKLVQDLRRVNPDLIYVCDTVMGDIGRGMYVPETLLPIYKEKIIRLADIATPNQFEAELLSGITISKVSDAWKACDWFHKQGVKTVVLSSTELGDDENLVALASQEPDVGSTKKLRVIQRIPKIEGSYTGTGDFFSALILAHYYKSKNIGESLEKTIATMQSVLTRTLEMAKGTSLCVKKNIELKIIQSKKDIENPQVLIKAEIVND